jgi:radical SAM superfamily enzyme YgiQ (UPF0313 family)
VALVWPGGYRAGMSSLGFLWCYSLVNARQEALAERVFLPEDPRAPVRSLESGRPLSSFALVAASLSWENDYWVFPEILRRGGVPPERSARGNGSYPLICAGGIGPWSNPWALFPFADLIFTGEGEICWEAALDCAAERGFGRLDALSRTRALAGRVPGALAPGLLPEELTGASDPDRLRAALAAFAPVAPPRLPYPFPARSLPPASPVWAPGAEFSGMRLVEISRGCPHGCRFCLAGHVYRPHRPWDAKKILEAVARPNPWSGEDPFPADAPVGLVGAAAADHPGFEGIVEEILATGRRISFSSLRLSALGEKALRLLAAGGLRGAAVAPEAGTEELRARIAKGLSEPEILEGARILGSAGLRTLKLYFMFGLPGETDGDLEAAADLSFRILQAARGAARGKPGVLAAASFSCFVPKPHTPFEDEPLLTEGEIRRRSALLRALFARRGGVSLRLESPRSAVIQGVIARGGVAAGQMVRALLESSGREGPALRLAGVTDDHPAFRPVPPDGPRPWRIIASAPGKEYLAEEARKAPLGRESPPCPPALRCGRCAACGSAGPGGPAGG